MNVVDVLLEAKGLVIDHNWVGRAPLWHALNEVCAHTAISRAAERTARPNVGTQYEAMKKAMGYFSRAISKPSPTSITFWNDTPGRTKQEVIDAFDEAIRLAKEDLNTQAGGDQREPSRTRGLDAPEDG